MKKSIYVVIIALFLLILTGCDDSTNDTMSHGTWHGHIYVNELMGFQFELPVTWYMYTVEEKAFWSSVAFPHMINEYFGGNPYYLSEYPTISDMRSREFLTENTVAINIQELSSATARLLNTRDVLRDTMNLLLELDVGYHNFHIGESTRQLGNSDWHYMFFERYTNRASAFFVSMHGRFLYTIHITIHTGTKQDIEAIWELFSDISPLYLGSEGIIPTIRMCYV